MVKRAAELRGCSVGEFVVAAALEVAHRTISESEIIRLSAEEQQRFVDLLMLPRTLTPALKRAKKAHARLIACSR